MWITILKIEIATPEDDANEGGGYMKSVSIAISVDKCMYVICNRFDLSPQLLIDNKRERREINRESERDRESTRSIE